MNDIPKALICGRSGDTYPFEVYGKHVLGQFNNVPGVYVFAALTHTGEYRPLYVGETERADQRLVSSHEKVACVSNNGWSHICFLQTHTYRYRHVVEQDLIQAHNPVCNGGLLSFARRRLAGS